MLWSNNQERSSEGSAQRAFQLLPYILFILFILFILSKNQG